MGISAETLAAAMSYTNTTVAGGGAIKGKNCTITNITNITGGKRVTFQWTLDNGTVQTDTLDVMDGVQGDAGIGIHSVRINSNSHLIVTYDDGTIEDAGEVQGGGGASIDDSTPAYNKVYSSEKTTELVSEKLDASLATISGGGENLCNFTSAKYNFKPGTTVGTSTWNDGTVTEGSFATTLWTYTPNEKIKFKIDSMPSYFRYFYYDANGYYKGGGGNYTTDTDGYPYVSTDKTCSYMCLVFGSTTEANFRTLVVGRYDTFGETKVVINDLYLSDNNVEMAKTRLGITTDILSGKKWAVAGDSFTAGDFTGVTEPTIPSGKYVGQLAVYPYLIGNRCDMDIQNLSKGGRTLALPSGEGSSYNSFVNHYQSVAADADYLTIYFGINDSHKSDVIPLGTIDDDTTATFYGAWNVILSWLIENRPNLHIGIIVSNGCDTDDYRQATLSVATKYGIPYMDLNGDSRTPCMIRSTNPSIPASIRTQRTATWRVSPTNAHPNAECHAYEATFIENFLRTL